MSGSDIAMLVGIILATISGGFLAQSSWPWYCSWLSAIAFQVIAFIVIGASRLLFLQEALRP